MKSLRYEPDGQAHLVNAYRQRQQSFYRRIGPDDPEHLQQTSYKNHYRRYHSEDRERFRYIARSIKQITIQTRVDAQHEIWTQHRRSAVSRLQQQTHWFNNLQIIYLNSNSHLGLCNPQRVNKQNKSFNQLVSIIIE